MALLTNGLSTIELGSISWRQVINQNFVYLDNNRIFVVEADANLPTSEFKNGRFFYSKATKSFWHDNGTLLTKIGGGTDIDITSNPDKFIKINAAGTELEYVSITSINLSGNQDKFIKINSAGTALEYVSIESGTEINIASNPDKFVKINAAGTELEYVSITSSGGLSNRVDPTVAETLNSLYVSTDNPTTSNFINAYSIASFGYDNKFLNSSGDLYCSTVFGVSNQNIGPYNTIIGSQNKITDGATNNNTMIGNNNKAKGYFNILLGTNQELSPYWRTTTNNNILIGENNFSTEYNKTYKENILIGKWVNRFSNAIGIGYNTSALNINNSSSFNLALNQIIRKVSYYKSALTSSTLTNIYIDGQSTNTESLNLTPSSFNNISGNITIYNKTTEKCKKISINMIVFVNGSGIPNVKQFTKTTIFEDIEYSGADINFLTTSNQFVLQVNTNNLDSDIIAEIDIEEK